MPQPEEIDEKALALRADYKAVFGSPAGERVLDDLKNENFYERSTFFAQADSMTHWQEGKRAALLQMLYMLNDAATAAIATRQPEQED